MITIIDYGAGNIKSIQNMLRKIGQESIISNDREVIAHADKLILPGVGHFDFGMKNLNQSGLVDILSELVLQKKKPLLGICLGAQLLGKSSEEGKEKGLGWIDMKNIKFDIDKIDSQLKIPHMGWNEITVQQSSNLLNNLEKEARFYFVHSFHMETSSPLDVLASTNYGYSFTSAVKRDNIYGVQFHPEKSHKFGMQLLKNFSKL